MSAAKLLFGESYQTQGNRSDLSCFAFAKVSKCSKKSQISDAQLLTLPVPLYPEVDTSRSNRTRAYLLFQLNIIPDNKQSIIIWVASYSGM